MATNREFTFEDYWAILRRRRWLLVLPVAAGVIGGFLLSLVLPEKYTSHTIVLVERPVVGDTYVKPVMTEDLNQRLAERRRHLTYGSVSRAAAAVYRSDTAEPHAGHTICGVARLQCGRHVRGGAGRPTDLF